MCRGRKVGDHGADGVVAEQILVVCGRDDDGPGSYIRRHREERGKASE
jgi:hypothetical protein